jgi:signal transduction histidine kinase
MKKFFARKKERGPSPDRPRSFFHEVDIEFLIHELKDPIAVIETGMRTLLEREERFGPLTVKQRKVMQRVLRNARKAREMVRGLLEIGRSETGCFICRHFQPAQTTLSVVSEALETMGLEPEEVSIEPGRLQDAAGRQGIYIDIPEAARDAVLYQDEIKFRQITGNLIKNALHHRNTRIDIRLRLVRNRFLWEIGDDGPGVAPEHHEMVFKRYAQLRQCKAIARKGHGLGLAGAQILARCLGGDVELESHEGEGATFRLWLPIHFVSPESESDH